MTLLRHDCYIISEYCNSNEVAGLYDVEHALAT